MQRKHGKSRMLRWGTKLFEAVTSEVFHSSKGWKPGVQNLTR
jgi:hypothetical protein